MFEDVSASVACVLLMFSKLMLVHVFFLESVPASPMCKDDCLPSNAGRTFEYGRVEAELLRKCEQGIVQVKDLDDVWRHYRALKDSFTFCC